MAAQVMRRFHGLIGQGEAIGRPGLQRLLLDSGGIFMLTGTLILVHKLATTSTSTPNNDELIFIAFILWLLGMAFGMLSMVVRQFPRLAVAAAAVARTLHNYLLGGM